MKRQNAVFQNPFFRFLIQFISFLLILASLFSAFVFVIKTQEFIPVSPTVRYNRLLSDIYVSTDDWALIHEIEKKINLSELESDRADIYSTQVWNNYFKFPEEYGINMPPSSYVEDSGMDKVFQAHAGDFNLILKNRKDYLRSDGSNPFFSEMSTDPIEVLSELEIKYKTLRESLEKGSVSADEAAQSLEDIEVKLLFYKALAHTDLQYMTLPARYEHIVYDGFRRIRSPRLVETAKEILNNTSEDTLLRLLAADYLRTYGGTDFADQLYRVISDAQENGYYVEGTQPDSIEEVLFEREILRILGEEISK